jgi:hypothetical protein
MTQKRKSPNLSEKLASALLTICRRDESGRLIPVIDPDEAKDMTVKQILAVFEYDHTVLHALEGSNHPSNLTPRPIPEHRTKSKRDTSIAAKDKRLTPAHEAFQRKMLAKSGVEQQPEQIKQKATIKSQGFRGSRKFNGQVEWKR